MFPSACWRLFPSLRLLLVAALFSAVMPGAPVLAQGNNNNNNNNNNAGIKIDAQGVVSLGLVNDAFGGLDKKRREALAAKSLSQETNRASKLRLVSLVGLERQIDARLAKGEAIPDELFYLAGLQRIERVFVFPETKDLVIAGPAEGFAPDTVGRMIGVNSGRPVLRLDDLIVALRTVAKAREIGCSIDPVPERLAALQRFVSSGGPASAGAVEARFNQMDDVLGLQDVRVDGVPADSHFGVALVEADYRMKRVSMGLENPGVKGLKSHLAMLAPGGNTIQRWWFVPLYDGIARSEDGLAFQFSGQRAQLLSEEELSDSSGNRSTAPTTRLSTKAFAKQFTEKFPELAEKSPVFAELQNLIDWSVFAALVQQEQLANKVDWKMSTLLDEKRLGYPAFNAPKKIPSSVNYKRAGSVIVGLVGGGVTIQPQQVLSKAAVPAPASLRLESIRTGAASSPRSDAHPWWWDVTP